LRVARFSSHCYELPCRGPCCVYARTMCESVPRYVKRRYYMHAAARRGGFTARWEIRTRDVRVTRLGDARRRVVCVRRRWRRERLSERGESETAESRESRTRSRDMPPTRVRVTSRHISVSRKMCPGLRPAAADRPVTWSARAAWSRGTGRWDRARVCSVRVHRAHRH
jgi:hypothetical protein